jgi:hypothetical protein
MTIINIEQLELDILEAQEKLRKSMAKYDEMRQSYPEDSKDWNYLLGEIMGLQTGAIALQLITEKYFK